MWAIGADIHYVFLYIKSGTVAWQKIKGVAMSRKHHVWMGVIGALIWGGAQAQDATLLAARASAQKLGQALQAELSAAMQSGGPMAAIEVCNVRALPLAQQISQQQGWQVGRTSTRLRNPQNRADDWELAQLAKFAERIQAGESADTLEVLQQQAHHGQTVVRYMKAIVVQPACLACHGSALPDEVSARLDQLYPQDRARGYQAGDLRGAFTLQRVAEP